MTTNVQTAETTVERDPVVKTGSVEVAQHGAGSKINTNDLAPLRIGVFGIRTIPSTYSGYETFCNVLLPELVVRGHDVTLFTRESFGRQKSYKGVKKIGLPSINTKQLDTLSHSAVCATVSRFGQFDVILSFNVANAPSLAILTKTGVPTVLNVDGLEWKRGKWGKLARSVFYHCGKISKHTSTRLITDCIEMGLIYQSEFQADTEVIPYCWTGLLSDDELQTPDTEYLDQYGITARNYLITGGRLIPENNIAEIVESHVASDETMPIVVLGQANYDSPVQKRLYELAMKDERVKLLGHIDDRRGFGILLRDSFAYLHGHSVGGINPSLVEAMGVGAMICAFDTRFNREALGDAGVYFDTPTKAVDEMRSEMESHDIESFRIIARDRVKEKYSQKKIVDMYEEVLYNTAKPKNKNKPGTKKSINAEKSNVSPSGVVAVNDEFISNTRFGLSKNWHDMSTSFTPTLYTFGGKRLVDILVASALLIVLSPLLLVVAVLVRLKMGSGIFYKQKRVGRHGKTFNIYKFRTMLPDRRSNSDWQGSCRRINGHKTDDDPRHTDFGKKLRRFGLDEFPQLINVIKGDMSLVGPRPELDEVARKRGYFMHPRHLTRPGITGPYQLSGLRNEGDLSRGLNIDESYLKNVSMLTDFKYIVKTPLVLLSRTNRSLQAAN